MRLHIFPLFELSFLPNLKKEIVQNGSISRIPRERSPYPDGAAGLIDTDISSNTQVILQVILDNVEQQLMR